MAARRTRHWSPPGPAASGPAPDLVPTPRSDGVRPQTGAVRLNGEWQDSSQRSIRRTHELGQGPSTLPPACLGAKRDGTHGSTLEFIAPTRLRLRCSEHGLQSLSCLALCIWVHVWMLFSLSSYPPPRGSPADRAGRSETLLAGTACTSLLRVVLTYEAFAGQSHDAYGAPHLRTGHGVEHGGPTTAGEPHWVVPGGRYAGEGRTAGRWGMPATYDA